MAATQNKTQRHDGDVFAFVQRVPSERRRLDALTLLESMGRVTGLEPKMWGDSIVGYGTYHYRNVSGREGDFMLTGFSPRKASMSIYIMPGFDEFSAYLDRLGKHRHSVSCLYITRLANVDLEVLESLIRASVSVMKSRYPDWQP